MNFLDLLKEKIVVFDGAMGSSLQAQELSIEDWGGQEFENCSENLLYTKPEAIENGPRDFLEAGVDVIETNSFGGSRGRSGGIRDCRKDLRCQPARPRRWRNVWQMTIRRRTTAFCRRFDWSGNETADARPYYVSRSESGLCRADSGLC